MREQAYRSDRIYVTRVFLITMHHALHELFLSKFWLRDPNGAVAIYEVEPEGELIRDPEWSRRFHAWMAESAVVKQKVWEVTQQQVKDLDPEWFADQTEPFEDWLRAA